MTDQRLGLRVAGVIFGLISVGHLIRIFEQVEVRLGSYVIPMWPSVLAAVVSGLLAIWLFLLSKPKV